MGVKHSIYLRGSTFMRGLVYGCPLSPSPHGALEQLLMLVEQRQARLLLQNLQSSSPLRSSLIWNNSLSYLKQFNQSGHTK